MPPQPLVFPDSWGLSCSVTASSNFLLPPNSLSLGCLLPLACCALFPSGFWCLTSPGERDPYKIRLLWLVKSRVWSLVRGLKAGGCSAKSLNVGPDGRGCDARLEPAYILTGDPDSHCNRAKPLITGIPRARQSPGTAASSWRASQEESLKRLV